MEADFKRAEIKSNEELLAEIRNVLATASQVSNNNLIKASKTGRKTKVSKLQQKFQNIVGCEADSSQNIAEIPDWRQNNYSISFILKSSNCAKKFGFPCFKSCCEKSMTSGGTASTVHSDRPKFTFPKNRIEMLDLPPAPKTKLSEWYLSNFAIVRNNDEESAMQGTCKTVADIHKSLRVSTSLNKKEAKSGSLFKQVHEFEKSARNLMRDRDWAMAKEKIVHSKLPKSHGFWQKVIEKEPRKVTQVQLKCDKLRLGGSNLSQPDAVHHSSNVILLTKVAELKTFKPGPLSKKRTLLVDNEVAEKWDYKIQQIPSLQIVVKPEIGKQLSSVALKYVHLSQMKSSRIDENWARFALSTLTVNRKQQSPASEFAFKIPFKNDESKVLVKKQKKEVFEFDYGKMSSDNDVAAVLDNLLKFVEKKEFFDTHLQTLSRDPHDVNRNVEDAFISNENKPKTSSDALSVMKRSRTNKQLCELRRLNVQIIEVATMDQVETKQSYSGHVQSQCSKPICSYGCVCNSLKFGYDYVTNENAHCRNIECMFSCECGYVPIDRLKLKNMMFLPSGTDIMSTETVRRLQIKAQEHLSKEQKKFSQTVIQSQNKTIIVDDLQQKRVRKAAINCKMNFANGWIDDSAKGKESLAEKKKLKISQKSTKEFKADFQLKVKYPVEFNANKYMIYCMVHDFYNCPCKNNLTYEFRKDFLLSSPKAIRQSSATANNSAKAKFRNGSASASTSTSTSSSTSYSTTAAASNLSAASSSSSNTNKKSQNACKYTSGNNVTLGEGTLSRKSIDERFLQRNLRNRRHPPNAEEEKNDIAENENNGIESDDCEIVNDEDDADNTNEEEDVESDGHEDDDDDIDYEYNEDSEDYGYKRRKRDSSKNKKSRKQQKRNSDAESDDSFEPPLPAKAPHLKRASASHCSLPCDKLSNLPKLPPPLIRLSSPMPTRLPPLKTQKEQSSLPLDNSCPETAKQLPTLSSSLNATSHIRSYQRSSRIIQTMFDSADASKLGLPSLNAQWKSVHLSTQFYCLMLKEYNVAISYEDLYFAAWSSSIRKRAVLIELKMLSKGCSRPKGIYAIPSLKNRVFLGPFDLNDVIQLQVIGDKNQAPDIIEFVHIDKDQIFPSSDSSVNKLEHGSAKNSEHLLNKRKCHVENDSLHPRKKSRIENDSTNGSQDFRNDDDNNISCKNKELLSNVVHAKQNPVCAVSIDLNSNKTYSEADGGSEESIVPSLGAQPSSINHFPTMIKVNGNPDYSNSNSVPRPSKPYANSSGLDSSKSLTAAPSTTSNFLNPLNSAILMKNTNIQTFPTNGLDKSKINGWKWTKKWFVLKCPDIGYFSFYEFKKSNKTEYYFDNPTRKNERIHFKVVENIARYIYEILKKHIFFRPEKLKLNFRIITDPEEIKQIQPFNASVLNFTHILTETCLIKLTTLTADQLEHYNINNLNGVYVPSQHKNSPKANDALVVNIVNQQTADSNEELAPEKSSIDQHSLDTTEVSSRNSSTFTQSTIIKTSEIVEVGAERCENSFGGNVESDKKENDRERGTSSMPP